MQTATLIRDIKRLPLVARVQIMEQTLRSIRQEETKRQMADAANLLCDDYLNDRKLTAFTALDFEDFYETKLSLVD
ncbi:MAG: hypothetical protein LBT48_07095 [Prevotellaceae bacterium]|jgi:hypothetical protein|nr:hypothetical protein [Prevotellaceae bacterium]